MNTNYKNKPLAFLFTIAFLFVIPSLVSGSNISTTMTDSVRVGAVFPVTVYVDSNKESINSVDVVLGYNNSLLEFSGYKTENGVIKMWIVSPNEKQGSIYFSGIIPGGVSGVFDPRKSTTSAIPLVTLMFKAKNTGTANFSFIKSEILKNDGVGSVLSHDKVSNSINIKTIEHKQLEPTLDIKIENVDTSIDVEPPLPFVINFIKSSFFSRTPSMITFIAEDPGSGVKQYEIKINNGDWKLVESPYPIPKSLLSQILTVRATDFYGNTRESYINTVGFIDGNLRLNVWLVGLIALFLFVVLVYKLLQSKHELK